ncbi:hypothetical protein [Jatrophihabitans sp.]|uniref:hypothetical protein n=1 Tax=Jatrophihabitans sp. TaxID=1932789 RepID=UPI0030C734F8|nr:hypothetical protein [Jatrophihabitans sp.]
MDEPIDPNSGSGNQPEPPPYTPPPYAAPQPQHESPQYGTPSPYTAPQPQYGAPQQPQHESPQYGTPSPYSAPQPQYGAPQQPEYGPPQYNPAQPQYNAAQPQYDQYGQPLNGQYGQPQYGQYGQPPYGTPGYPLEGLPEQPRSRSRLKIVIAAVAVVVVVGVVLGLTLGSSSGSKTPSATGALVMPSTLGSYTRTTDASVDQIRESIQGAYGSSGTLGKFFSQSTIGVYSNGTAPTNRIVILAARASAFPQLNASSLSSSGASGVGPFTTYPAGSNGGSVGCTKFDLGQISEQICVWADKQTVGYMVSVNTGLKAAKVAALVNDARNSLDH